MAGKWVRSEQGLLHNLNQIESLSVASGGYDNGYQVRAWLPGNVDSYVVLFRHKEKAVCDEWLDKFIASVGLEVVSGVALTRKCPNCGGTGYHPTANEHDLAEPCGLCYGDGEVSLETYEETLAEWGVKP